MKRRGAPGRAELVPTATEGTAGALPIEIGAGGVSVPVDQATLLTDLRALVHAARQRLAGAANATHTHLCLQVGRRLLRDNLRAGRAAYGQQILATLSQELTAEFGAGFDYSSLTRMARFAEWMTDEQVFTALSTQLSWSHFVVLLPVKDPLARDFYAEMCRVERWDAARCGRRSAACCTSARPSRRSPRRSSRSSSASCARVR
jgi:hypothetical protein